MELYHFNHIPNSCTNEALEVSRGYHSRQRLLRLRSIATPPYQYNDDYKVYFSYFDVAFIPSLLDWGLLNKKIKIPISDYINNCKFLNWSLSLDVSLEQSRLTQLPLLVFPRFSIAQPPPKLLGPRNLMHSRVWSARTRDHIGTCRPSRWLLLCCEFSLSKWLH
jgi:hypothetical protein